MEEPQGETQTPVTEAVAPAETVPQVLELVAAPQKPTEMTQAERQTTLLTDLAAQPDSSNREVKNRLGWSDSTTAKWITRLTTQGYLTVDNSDWPYRYRLSEQTQRDVAVLVEAEVLPPVVENTKPESVETEAQAEADQGEVEPASEPAPLLSNPRTQTVVWLGERGPHRAKDVAAAFNLYPGPCAIQLNALVRDRLLMTLPGTSPVVYALPGTPLPVMPIEAQAPKPEVPSRAAPLPSDRTHRALLLDMHGPQSHRGLYGYMDVDFSGTTLQRLLTALGEEGVVEIEPGQTMSLVSLTSAGRARLAAYASGEIKPALPPEPSKKAQVAEVSQTTSFRPTPNQAELNATMRANAAPVLGLLKPGQEYVETELTQALGLNLSHRRLALCNRQSTGEVQRLDGVGTRAMYRLEQLHLPQPESDTLTPEGERVAARLAHVTARSASDTATNIASGLCLARADVDQALAVLNAQERLAYTRGGNLVVYALRNTAA
ncbi:hypothetical protein [Deinococcus sp. QL22]|uniref:hypothetical protein n=1 Tax=Deinococcus sp. QL22 TaxID=2939437 RepID=UPI00201767BA|nr:hypothetical protein [Deinococcus sp. QL22]UQN09073.1 hypothetical protein M1R55_23785 [Deinococcus sp. QL22]